VPGETGSLGQDKLKRKKAVASMQKSATPSQFKENECGRDYAIEPGLIQEIIMT